MKTRTITFWREAADVPAFPVLDHDIKADLLVIGGGITGITAAALMAREGKRVVVLESMQVGHGSTGHSTGNLHASLDEGLSPLRKKWGVETARLIAQARASTIDAIERTVRDYDIACGFVRCPHFVYPVDRHTMELLEEEQQAVAEAGLKAVLTNVLPLPIKAARALCIEDQAQFNPLLYVRALAAKIQSDRCHIYENSPVVAIDSSSGAVSTTAATVHAGAIFVATHTPKGFDPVQAELGPYREYGVAGLLDPNECPPGIYWSSDDPSISVRSYERDGRRYLIVVGEEHKTGQHRDGVDYCARLEDFARSHFSISSISHRWSAQNYRPVDLLPYIGASSLGRHYIATGFGTNGLVYGALAAEMVVDHLRGRNHPLHDLFKPTRFTPVKSAKEFLTENLNVAKQYARNYLTHSELKEMETVGPGEGALVDVDGTVAVYRDQAGSFTLLSPTCTHLGCKVHWNPLEQSWDCPCHGSRFTCEGQILEGPALTPLETLNLVEDADEEV